MSYILKGYIFSSKAKKPLKKSYGQGRCVFIGRPYLYFGKINISSEYIGKRFRVKLELIGEQEGMPKNQLTDRELLEIVSKARKEGYAQGKKAM